jgi:hypothetical protein
MNLPAWSSRRATAGLLLFFSLMVPGCSKKAEPVVMDFGSFASAPAALQQSWKAAAESAALNNYLGAATNLMAIFGNATQLTPDQNTALNQAWRQLGNKAFQAAESGDKMAADAVLKMRDSGFGKAAGGR